MRQKLNMILLAAAVASALCGGELLGRRASAQSSTAGTWTLYPAQTTSYTTSVRPPIKADGSSVFRANGSAVIPVKFKLSSAPGAFKFESVFSNNQPLPGSDPEEGGPEPVFEDDYAYLSFEPNTALLFNQLTVLDAVYSFTQGNCGGGALRWQVRVDIGSDNDQPLQDEDGNPILDEDGNPSYPGLSNDRSVFIYYGDYPNFTNCTTGSNNQSGVNLLTLTDLRFDTSQLVGGTFYDTLANAKSLAGSLKVVSASLVLDAGWRQDGDGAYLDQKVTLGGVHVNANQFTPITGDATTTCNLPPAIISITRLNDGSSTDPVSVQPPVNNFSFATTNDCTYSYNLSTGSLIGPGTYKVEAVIGTSVVPGGAIFKLQ